jgi:hypothetical protein
MLRFFRVEHGKLAITRQQESITQTVVGALAWRGDLVAAGDVAGGLTCSGSRCRRTGRSRRHRGRRRSS